MNSSFYLSYFTRKPLAQAVTPSLNPALPTNQLQSDLSTSPNQSRGRAMGIEPIPTSKVFDRNKESYRQTSVVDRNKESYRQTSVVAITTAKRSILEVSTRKPRKSRVVFSVCSRGRYTRNPSLDIYLLSVYE